ncbi:MAG: HAMP domain-containing sensor histidine kinase [Verrucomicrobiota bacterium]|jgi:signal transduction histidine kinase
MRRLLRHLSIGASRPATGWLTLLLLLAVLVPSACLLWFMNEAMRNERLAMRQKLMEAYRANLAQARSRLDSYWSAATGPLESNTLSAPALFATAIRADVADTVIIYDSTGKVAYPAAGFPAGRSDDYSPVEERDPEAAVAAFAELARDATNATRAARALQAQARCLIEAGKRQAALVLLTNSLAVARFSHAVDAQGRLIVPSAELLALELGGPASDLLSRLRAELVDYDNGMPAAQRRFLMHRLREMFPGQVSFPTLAAEDLAAEYLEGETTNTWPISAANGHLLLLLSADGLQRRLRGVAGADVTLLPPGRETGSYLVADSAGGNLPGWHIAPAADDRGSDAAAEAQIASYFWVGIMAVAAVVVLALLAVGLIRRQVAVAQLRNDLVANVTHELKTPLSSMRLLVDTLLNSPTLDEQTARQYLQLIAGENLRLSRLIDNFLAFSRMERNKQAFEFSETRPQQIVESAAGAVRERFNTPDCSFQAEVAPDLPAIFADTDALVTAVVNLLDNAYKYSGEPKEIQLRAGAKNGQVVFSVTDNGIGLAPRETRRIFKRFYQVDQRLARAGGGCGLGLSIVQFIVTAHHGTVGVESEPGRGSTFTISIPAKQQTV